MNDLDRLLGSNGEVLYVAATPRTPNGAGAGGAQLVTDYVEVTVEYILLP